MRYPCDELALIFLAIAGIAWLCGASDVFEPMMFLGAVMVILSGIGRAMNV